MVWSGRAALAWALIVSSAFVACTGSSSRGGGDDDESSPDPTGGTGDGASGGSGTGPGGEGGNCASCGGSDSGDGGGDEPGGDGGQGGTSTGGVGGAAGTATGGAGAGGMNLGGVGGASGMSTAGGGSSSGSGGSGGSSGDAGAGGSGGCFIHRQCTYVDATEPDTASLKDQQSFRQEYGYYCVTPEGAVWNRDTVCAYSEVCDSSVQGAPACVACGEDGRRTLKRTVNGVVTDECEGCSCHGWNVYCFASTAEWGEPWVDLTFQRNTAVLRMDVTVSGRVPYAIPQGTTATVTNRNITIASNGLVEFDVVADYSFTNALGNPETWHVTGHVVDRCQQ